MKVIYLTDIHDSLKGLRELLASTEADLYLLSGDILYKAFYEEEKIYNFVCLQEEFYQLARQFKQNTYPLDLALEIIRFPKKYITAENNVKTLQEKAHHYRQLFEIAAKTMKGKYTLIKKLIEKYAQATSWVLPGNYDIDLHHTDLEALSLHCQIKYKDSLKFSGYGGAPVQTSGIPEKLAIDYHETQEDGQLYSEPLHFFKQSEPDVLVLHNPAYGYFDCIPSYGHVGSQGIRRYLDEHSPSLVLSGHVHEDYGVALRNGTIFLNPSNFGGVDSPQGFQPGGSYAEIYFTDTEVVRIVFMQMKQNKLFPIMSVENKKQELIGKLDEQSLISLGKDMHLNPRQFIRDANGVVLGDS